MPHKNMKQDAKGSYYICGKFASYFVFFELKTTLGDVYVSLVTVLDWLKKS